MIIVSIVLYLILTNKKFSTLELVHPQGINPEGMLKRVQLVWAGY